MARYRCDQCTHRENGFQYSLCKLHKKGLSTTAIDPPDFCYVWARYGDPNNGKTIKVRWYKQGKLE